LTTIGTETLLLPAGLVTLSVTVDVPAGSACGGGAWTWEVPPGNVQVQVVGSPVEVSVTWTVPSASWALLNRATGLS
jgi:hypothetical protein